MRAIQDYKNNQLNFCEWYINIARKCGTNTDDDFIAINCNILKASIKFRHCLDFKLAFTVIDKNIAGYESLGASWF